MFDAVKAHAAQEEHCDKIKAPRFSPGPYNNYRCYRCRQNIYSEKGHPVAERLRHGRVRLDLTKDVQGISVEKASKELICGCPFCNASFDD